LLQYGQANAEGKIEMLDVGCENNNVTIMARWTGALMHEKYSWMCSEKQRHKSSALAADWLIYNYRFNTTKEKV